MWHIGIDLHRKMLVMAAVNDNGEAVDPVRIDCQDTAAMVKAVERLRSWKQRARIGGCTTCSGRTARFFWPIRSVYER